MEPIAWCACAVSDPYAALGKPVGEDPDRPVLGRFHPSQNPTRSCPDLNVVLSIGGWWMSERRSDIARAGSGRRAFASARVALVREYGFDGLEVDRDYPVEGGEVGSAEHPERPEDPGEVQRALREGLDAAVAADGRTSVRGAAMSVDLGGAANLGAESLAETQRWIGVMADDMRSPAAAPRALRPRTARLEATVTGG